MGTAKEKLMYAVEILLQNKNLDDIHVNEIVELAEVSRKTFYRNFIDKYDLVANYFFDFYHVNFDMIAQDENWETNVYNYLAVCENKKDILRHAYASKDYNNLKENDLKYTRESFVKLLKNKNVNVNSEEIKFAIEIATYGGTEMNIQWILDGAKVSKEKQVELLKRTLPMDILKYIDN